MDTKPVRLLFAVLTGLLTTFACAQNVFGDGQKAFALMPSEAISSGVVSAVSISNSGRLILFQRQIVTDVSEKPSTVKAWYLYDRSTKSTRRLTIPVTSNITVMSDDNNLVYTGFSADEKSGILNLSTGSSIPIDLQSGYLLYGGNKSFAPFLMMNDGKDNISLISPDGKTRSVTFGENLALTGPVAGDKENIYFHAFVKKSNPRSSVRLTMNRSSGQISQKPYRNSEEWNDLHPELANVVFSVHADGEYSLISYRPGLSNSPLPYQIRIGPGDGFVQLSSQNNFVLYLDAGSLLLRDIKPVDLELANKLLAQEVLTKLVKRGRQIEKAICMWAGDHDDAYPGQNGWEQELQPYIRERDGFKDFNYTCKGGNAKEIENPWSTELGFLVADNGRVVVYADGHAKFVPNP